MSERSEPQHTDTQLHLASNLRIPRACALVSTRSARQAVAESLATQHVGCRKSWTPTAKHTHLCDKHESEVPGGVVLRPVALLRECSEGISCFCEGRDRGRGHFSCKCSERRWFSAGSAIRSKSNALQHACYQNSLRIYSGYDAFPSNSCFLTKLEFEMEDTMTPEARERSSSPSASSALRPVTANACGAWACTGRRCAACTTPRTSRRPSR